MSVEPCVIRVTPQEFAPLRQYPETLSDFIEEGYETGAFSFGYSLDAPLTRMIHLDKFMMFLLTGFDDDSPLCRALIGWDGHLLEGAAHGHGSVFYHTAEEVRAIAAELAALPTSYLRGRFESRAEDFRRAAGGDLDGDEAILNYQMTVFRRVRQFYREAADQGDLTLMLLM